MLNKIKHTLSSTAIYSFGNALTKLIGVILLPLYTDKLTTGEYGIWAILETVSLILTSIFALNIPTAMLRWCAQEKDKIKEKSIIFTSFISMIVIAILLFLSTYPLSEFISNLIWPDKDYTYLFELLFISVFFEIVGRHPHSLIRLREKQFFYVTATSIKLVVILSLNIYFIVGLGKKIDGIILSRIIGQGVFLLFTAPLMIKNFSIKVNTEVFSQMLKYSIPLVVTTLSNFAFSQSDRFIIPFILGEESLGIYNVGLKFGSVINMLLIQSFNFGFLPIAFKMFDKPDTNRYFTKVTTYYSLILVLVGLSISLVSKELIEVLISKKEYWIAYDFIPLIVLGFMLRGVNQLFSLGYHYKKSTGKLGTIVLICSGVSISLNILLLPAIGLYAAPIAVIVSMLIMNTLSYYYSNKLLKIDFEFKKIILLLITGMILFCFSLLINDFDILNRLILKLVLVFSLPFILVPFGFYEEIEKQRIKEIFGRWRDPSAFVDNIKKLLNGKNDL